ncbi:chemotaxis protein CheW [Reinekea blandensis]|uniref:Protein containing CheW-like domain n=1 Tax=Reinekea blandensis MED297 TaxID=314283 RepID=A4BK20_9GAMM|nr:chemotaxis protein CheW [Reinekea blandensis]EAR07553.1 protein containing CheW-like domain [Reinekea sp. MED297] [Reinekea blandensis MED297]
MKKSNRLSAGDENNVVSSLLVPVQNKSLLVPNVVVAEVVPLAQMENEPGTPPWHLGYIQWRGERIPVLSFEIANSQVHARDSDNARLAVMNATTGQSRHQFFAVLVQGIPRMIKLTDNEVREDKQVSRGDAEQMAVITQLGKAVIPDLNYLENLLTKLA